MFGQFQDLLARTSVWAIPVAYAGGVVVGFTPCVYPVLPVLIGYMGSRAEKSRRRMFLMSVLYVLGMAVMLAALGAAAALVGKAVSGTAGFFFAEARTNAWTNIVVGLVIAAFAFVMMGLVRLPVPAFLSRRSARPSGRYIGSLTMGMASAMITGPCVGAVAGPLLVYLGAEANVAFGVLVMFAFALGIGSPLVVLGTFTGLLASLPKSGPWLNTVKYLFAALMLAVGLGWFVVYKGVLAALDAV